MYRAVIFLFSFAPSKAAARVWAQPTKRHSQKAVPNEITPSSCRGPSARRQRLNTAAKRSGDGLCPWAQPTVCEFTQGRLRSALRACAAFKPPRSEAGVGAAHCLRIYTGQAAERPSRVRSVQTAAKRSGCGHSPPQSSPVRSPTTRCRISRYCAPSFVGR